MTTILFWDIDGTLLDSGGAGRLAFAQAATEMLGTEVDLATIEMAGRTDWAIATMILQPFGIAPEPAKVEELFSLYQQYLPDSLSKTQGYVLSGVREILEALRQRLDVYLLLLTGNIEAGAWAKLSHYGLDTYFNGGAFGGQTADRIGLARSAFALAQEKVTPIALDKCYVIGDTPHDIRCGQAIGARTIAIASGRYSAQELASYDSWLVWQSFPDPVQFMHKVGLN